MVSTQGRTCVICEQNKLEGIAVCERWICTTCELEIVQTDVQDPKYPFFIHQLRQVWYRGEA